MLRLLCCFVASAVCMQQASRSGSRRQLMETAVSGLALMVPTTQAAMADDEMRTSSSMKSYEDVTGQSRGANLGAGSVSGKSRPETGVVLVEPPSSEGGAVRADIVISGSLVARVAFDTGAGLSLAKGMYYDVEARNKKGDSAYVQVVPKKDSLLGAVFAPQGRYGAFGAPSDVEVKSDNKEESGLRLLDVAFSAAAPSGSLQPRRAKIAVISPTQSDDLILLVSSASEKRWNDGGNAVADQVARSFRIDSLKPTKLAPVKASDFGFEERGGIRSLFPD